MGERVDICREAPDAALLVGQSSCHFMGSFNWVIFTPDFGVGGSGTKEMPSGSVVVFLTVPTMEFSHFSAET